MGRVCGWQSLAHQNPLRLKAAWRVTFPAVSRLSEAVPPLVATSILAGSRVIFCCVVLVIVIDWLRSSNSIS